MDIEGYIADKPTLMQEIQEYLSSYKEDLPKIPNLSISVDSVSCDTQDDLRKINKIISEIKTSEIKNYKIDNISIGEHAYSGVLRYFARGEIPNSINSKKIYMEYFRSALITYFMSVKLFSENNYDKIILNHGIYTPQGVICDVANKFNVEVVTWYTSYRKKTVTLSHKGTYHKTLLNDEYKDLIKSLL